MFGRTLTVALMAALLAGTVTAANTTWLGTTSDEWNNAANWSAGVPANSGGDPTFLKAVTAPAKDPNISAAGAGVAGITIGNGGHLHVNARMSGSTYGLVTGTASNGYFYVNAGGIVDIAGDIRIAKNIYIGNTVGTAVVNVLPTGTVNYASGTTLTFGEGATANIIGQLNVWGIYRNAAIRWGHPGGSGRLTVYDSGEFTILGDNRTLFQSKIDAGEITSGTPAYVPAVVYLDPNNGNSTSIRLVRTPKATQATYTPALLSGNTAPLYGASGTIALSWVKPLPGDPAKPVTSNIYMGLDDGSTLPQVASGIAGNSYTAGIEKLKQYAWRVDSYDPNTGVTTASDVWKFNTNNFAPTVTAEASPIWMWLSAGSSITLHATAIDDGYPVPSSLTYTWSQTDGTKDVLPTPVTGQDVTLTFPYAVNFNFQVVASDGSATSAAYPVQVRVFATACAAAKDKSPAAVQPGDFNKDCIVNTKDMAIILNDWLSCTSADGVCP
jgi:hypothetical protein